MPGLHIPRKNKNPRLRLFCFPYSGANASLYYPWADVLPEAIEVCSLQYPGHGNRVAEPLTNRLSELVEQTISVLKPEINFPYAFFGHSLGALLVFELTRQLQSSGERLPDILIVSGHGAPQLPDRNPTLHILSDGDFMDKIVSLGGMDAGVVENRELMDLILPALKTDFEVCETYKFKPGLKLNCPISAYGGLEDPYVTRDELAAWEQQTCRQFLVRMFPGNHFYLNSSRHLLLQTIARELSQFLGRA